MPPREYHFWVYILASRSRNLYIGMTNNLTRRLATHREGIAGSHTASYNIHRLVHCEYFRYVRSAIAREKELKHWTREEKVALIESKNPTWVDQIPPESLQAGVPFGSDSKAGKRGNACTSIQLRCVSWVQLSFSEVPRDARLRS